MPLPWESIGERRVFSHAKYRNYFNFTLMILQLMYKEYKKREKKS
jgi:hypothetical protein